MRTTIRLNEQLMHQLKSHSLKAGESVTALITQALRQFLNQQNNNKSLKKVKLPTFKGNGVLPGVDLDCNASILDNMEDL